MSEQLTTVAQTDASSRRVARCGSSRPTVRAGVLAGLLIIAAACSSRTENTSGTSSQTPETPPAPTVTWDGTAPDKIEVPYPGRVALPDETCQTFGITNPQPLIMRDEHVFGIVDARRSVPPQCDYLLDSGAGARQGASYTAPVQKQPEGDQWIPDGTVVDIQAYSLGQRACNDSGASPVWIQFERQENGPDSWLPSINMAGISRDQLDAAGIPVIPNSPYEGTVHANC